MSEARAARQSSIPAAAWIAWAPAALFFAYGFFQRTSPGVMADSLMRDFSVDATLLGNLAGLYFYAYAGLQLGVGVTLDRLGPRRVLVAAALLCAAGTLLFALAEEMWLAGLGRFLIGAGAAFSWIGALTVTAIEFPPRRFAFVAGLGSMAGMAGAILAQAPLALLVDAVGWRPAMLGAAALPVLCAAMVAAFVRDRPPGSEARAAGPGLAESLGRAAARMQTWIISLYTGAVITAFIGLVSLWGVPYLMQVRGFSRPEAAAAISAALLAQGVASPGLGWLSDRIGRRKPVLLACPLIGLSGVLPLVLLPGLPSALVYLCLALTGAGSAGIILGFTVVREATPLRYAGAASGIVNTFVMGFSAGVQPLIGWILDRNWSGASQGSVRLYSPEAFQAAFATLPAALLVAAGMGLLVRETWCRPTED